MSWLVVGGMGWEEPLWEKLGKPSLKVIGSAYDLSREAFAPAPWSEGMFGEYVTPHYAGLFAESDGILCFPSSLLACYLSMDLAMMYTRPLWMFLPDRGKLAYFPPGSEACLGCLQAYEPPRPAILWDKPDPSWLDLLTSMWSSPPLTASLWDSPSTGPLGLVRSPTCPLHGEDHPYASGKQSLIVAVSCGENSVAITPSFERTIDLSQYVSLIKPFVHIRKTNAFFVEMEYEGLVCLVFRQGRFIVKGTKEKNSALFLYQQLVGV